MDLTLVEVGADVWINPREIALIEGLDEGHTRVTFANRQGYIVVGVSVRDVMKALGGMNG
jgi:competence transcription factor ComK